MSLDGRILAQARDILEKRRRENEAALARRRESVYARNPRLRRIDDALRDSMLSAMKAALSGGDAREALAAVKEENLGLQEQRTLELTRMGLPMDYLDEKYMCPDCHDTGARGTELCHCLMDIYRQEQARDLSALLKVGEETFDTFNLGYYPDTVNPATGHSPRQVMEVAYETCLMYARKFSLDTSLNLFLSGPPGLGKTFLSACIAREVAAKGYSVVYETAVDALSKYEAERFGRGDAEALRADIRRMETCDLLILDDLGTEYPTVFSVTALYALINARLIGRRRTVINLTPGDLEKRYNPAIMSRINGEFRLVKFEGGDIRRLLRDTRFTKRPDR